MRRKTLTVDCLPCDHMDVNDRQQFVCQWGQGNKIMEPQKGKIPLQCRLIMNKEGRKKVSALHKTRIKT
jgi:hypothetical protein